MNGFWLAAQELFELDAHELFQSAELWIIWMSMATAYAAVIALAVAIVNLCFRRWLSPRSLSWMWGIVLIRLLMPFAPASSWSLLNLIQPEQVAQTEDVTTTDTRQRYFGSTDDAQTELLSPSSATPAPTSLEPSLTRDVVGETWMTADTILYFTFWVCIAIGLIHVTRSLIVHTRFCRRAHFAPTCDNPQITTLWADCCDRARVVRIPVKWTEELAQPAILGALSPCLLMPHSTAQLSNKQLRMVMFHELGHVRAHDIAINWILLAFRVLYWWNPLYWLCTNRMERLREQACDAYAIRMMEDKPVREYGELLLMLALQQHATPRRGTRIPASILGFFKTIVRKQAVENRLRALRHAVRRPTVIRRIAGCAAIALTFVCGLSDASFATPPKRLRALPGYEFNFDSEWSATQSGWCLDEHDTPRQGATIIQEYDLSQSLPQVEAFFGNQDNGRMQLQSMLLHHIRGSTGRYQSLPKDWERSRVTFEGDRAIIDAPPLVHDDLCWQIAAWERNLFDPQICTGMAFIGDDANFDAIDGLTWTTLDSFSATPEAALISQTHSGSTKIRAICSHHSVHPIRVARMTESQVQQLRKQGCTIQDSAKITSFNGQRSRLFAGTQRPFVTGISLDADASRKPRVALVNEGFQFSSRFTEFDDRNLLRSEVKLEMSELSDVTTASTIINGEPALIQVPHRQHWEIEIETTLQNDESLLIGCIPQFADGRTFYLLLTMRKLREEMLRQEDD